PLELAEEPLDRPARREPCRLDPRPPAEPVDLHPGVLAEHPRPRPPAPPAPAPGSPAEPPPRRLAPLAVLGLGPRVLVVGRAGLGWILGGVERLQLQAERRLQVAERPRALRGGERP